MIEYHKIEAHDQPAVAALYREAGWIEAGADTGFIARILESSHWIGAYDEGRLIGMGRAICDHALQTPLCLDNLDIRIIVPDSNSRRIITSVFQFRKSIQKYRCCLLISYESYFLSSVKLIICYILL